MKKINSTILQKALVKLFDNRIGRIYLGVPKGKHIYKITQSSCHYYTGEIAKNGLPIICTGACSPAGKFVFNRIMRLARVVSAFAFLPFFPQSLLPLIALVDTGWKNPTATGGTYNDWANPTNAYSSDDNRTSVNFGPSVSPSQSYETFGFSIPAGATINGIEAKNECYASGVGDPIDKIWLSLHSVSGGGDSGLAPTHTTSEVIYTLGGASNLWNLSWTPSDFSDANFYCYLTAEKKGAGAYTAYVDHIQLKVYYTMPTPSPSISDQLNITENVSIENTALGGISVSDQLNITESITTNISDLSINVSDTISIQDIPTYYPDKLTIKESITMEVGAVSERLINVSDNVSITESIVPEISSLISVSDALTITENITVDVLPPALLINVNDNVSITEDTTLENTQLGNINVSDQLNLTESALPQVAGVALNISVNDVLTITENIVLTNTQLKGINVSDQLNLTESIVSKVPVSISVNDTLTLTESVGGVMVLEVSVFDGITLTESIVLETESSISVSDLANISESAIILHEATAISVSDAITITESFPTLIPYLVSISDAITLIEDRTVWIHGTIKAEFGLIKGKQQSYPSGKDMLYFKGKSNPFPSGKSKY